ncbi:MAG: phosphoribosyl-ATP diphosphatase [Spirochaetaceae bacterium]|jgi:phosphoribosyl-ATP pyrophosphohydrolase/phosphoribosyl-AMP cyclohydrolase|nr:phosphoribosyl-ATP diphosphatase [Spirochaetaceae bacterium]
MVIASIDIQNGKVVQLRRGAELVLERDNPEELAEEFNRFGEVAVIDLDAAMGRGSNLERIKPLFRRAECRAGGGIRTVEQARELISLGARKVITGSSAFRNPAKKGAGTDGGEFTVNREFLAGLAKKIGRERVIVAVDAKKNAGGTYEIVVDGWKTATGLSLIESARTVSEYAGELLFTCVDREGTMSGIDMEAVRLLKNSISAGVTAAGGVSTLAETAELAALGCDVQLGMALYTGKVSLADAFVHSLNWEKGGGLLPVIAQSPDGQVLMTGFADRNAVEETFRRQKLCFYSRTRQTLWMKGETSGNTLGLVQMRADCDRDALLAVVEPRGPVCHTGAWSCFGLERRYTLEFLHEIIAGRFKNPVPGSYTATLDRDLVREKIAEEAEELCAAETREETVWEAADLLYFVTALLAREGIPVEEVFNELDRRHKK